MTTSAGAMPIAVFCETYGVGRTKTYELLNSGAISARKSGTTTLIDRASAERWYESLPSYRAGRSREKITQRGRAEVGRSFLP
jgi:excisionase family DNA binding protein